MTSVFDPTRLGPVSVRNRFIRAGTGESMADSRGHVSDDYARLHEDLARGGVGLAFTGHLFVHRRGRHGPLQAGIDSDDAIPGLRRTTGAVHRQGGRIFAQLAHAGSQSVMSRTRALAPSAVSNVMTGREVAEATEAEITEAVEAFAQAARRAMEAGFDAVHLHGANGYLISAFRSPLANRRDDLWGGEQQDRERFPLEVIEAVRRQVPADKGLTMKVGLADLVDEPGGLTVTDAVAGVERFVAAGLDGVEVSSNLMRDYVSASSRPYVAVDRKRALEDLLLHRVARGAEPEAYFLPFADAVRDRVDTSIILVGGVRRLATIESILGSGRADFVSMARPFIREPDLVQRLQSGAEPSPACVSCNICAMHGERDSLRCWREPRRNLLKHALVRLRGGLKAQEFSDAPTDR